jgi:8-oxo-dGTP diphosphatase
MDRVSTASTISWKETRATELNGQEEACLHAPILGMVQVVAAILERDGKILIGQRQETQSHPLKWEFPGGKVELGETPERTLARELEEELAISDAAGYEITRYEYAYPGREPILLIFYRVLSFVGEPQNCVFREIRWEPAEHLSHFDFVEGDQAFIASFVRGIG